MPPKGGVFWESRPRAGYNVLTRFCIACYCNAIPWGIVGLSGRLANRRANIWAFQACLCGQQKVLDRAVFVAPNLSSFASPDKWRVSSVPCK